jgi:acyl-CoA reductase-like NAD-dependent aldehyde dehydrogenase
MLSFFERSMPRWLKDEHFRYWRPGFWMKKGTIVLEPVGIVAVIGPSNFPFSLPLMQACQVLLCGNGAIIKPSERCPKTAELLQVVLERAQFPRGIVQVIEGGAETAAQLVVHPAVNKVIFTGRRETGHQVAALCGQHFKPCLLELGSGGAAIVCAEADLTLAARGILWSACYAGGRSCVGTRTIYAEGPTAHVLRRRLAKEAVKLKRGHLLDPDTDISIECDAAEGLVVQEVGIAEEAVAVVNASAGGLSASIWCRDAGKAERLGRALDVGIVWINDASAGQPQFPWGGRKSDGWGRLFSRHAISELTNPKVISHSHRTTARAQRWWFPYSAGKYELFAATNRLWYGRKSFRALLPFLRALRCSGFH